VSDFEQTVFHTFFGVIFIVFVFLFTYALFGSKWISTYTVDGLLLWILCVTILSVFAQTFFFVGVLFNKYLHNENGFLLAVISISAFQTLTFASPPWVVANIVGSAAKIVVAWRTHNIYGAAVMGIASNLVDILVQIL